MGGGVGFYNIAILSETDITVNTVNNVTYLRSQQITLCIHFVAVSQSQFGGLKWDWVIDHLLKLVPCQSLSCSCDCWCINQKLTGFFSLLFVS